MVSFVSGKLEAVRKTFFVLNFKKLEAGVGLNICVIVLLSSLDVGYKHEIFLFFSSHCLQSYSVKCHFFAS